MKFTVYIENPSAQITSSHSTQSQFAANVGLETKFGLKFGINGSTTKSGNYSVVININDYSMGDALLGFHEPCILNITSVGAVLKAHHMREIDGGRYLLTVFPKKQY